MAEIAAKSKRDSLIAGVIRALVSGLVIYGSVYLILEGIKPIIWRDAPAIQAFASVIKALGLPMIVSAIVSLAATGAWALERRGKKRALKEKAKLQRQIEAGDAYRSSSNNPL